MTVTEVAIKRPRLIIVIFLMLAVLGFYGYNQLKYELLPDVTPPYVTVMTVYPGASPQEVETSITKPIEDAVSGVNKIKKVFSNSAEGMSFVFIEFQQNANGDFALQDAQRKVNEILTTLPAEAKTPILSKFSISEQPIIRMGAYSTMPAKEFYQLLKDKIKPRLTKLTGVGQLTFVGGEEREIKINLNQDKLNSFNLSVGQVLQVVKSSNLDFPAGNIKDRDGQYTVRLAGKFKSIDEIRNLVVSNSKDGGQVKLKDVAEVEDGEKETTTISRINKRTAVGILIQKQSDANAVEVSKVVTEELSKIQNDYVNYNIKFEIASDNSEFTLKSAEAVNHDLYLAIFLVAVVMLIFLHSMRNSIIVMLAIPCSFATTFVAMWALGFSLNLMTLLALSLVIGILVDDSIVVLENIHRHLEMNKDQQTASLDGRNEIGFSALSITLVDVVVFLPIALINGMIGNILRQFALVVVVSTLSSLLVSFTVTPMLASRFTRVEHLSEDTLMGKLGIFFENKFNRLIKHYLRVLTWALNNRKKVLLGITVLFFGSFFLVGAGFVGAEFMTPSDRGELSVIMELPERSTLAMNNINSQKAESILMKMPEVKRVFTNVGSSSEGFIGQSSNNTTEFTVSLVEKKDRTKDVTTVSREIKDKLMTIPGAKVRVTPVGIFGVSEGSPIMVVINGSDFNEVMKQGKRVKEMLKKIKGTADVRLSILDGKPELRVNIDREKMASLGLSLDNVGGSLRIALTGDDDSKYRVGSTEYDLRIVLDEADRNKTVDLAKMKFMNTKGQLVELQQFATIEQSVGPSVLERKNRNSSVTILSQAIGRPSGDIGTELKENLKNMTFPSGITYSFEGDLDNQDDSFGSLLIALFVGILFVYLIMVALYDSWIYPFVVLFSLPVALIGALFGLAVMMKTINIFSILGIIMLMGLVGKNAILLVDRANQMRAEGLSIMDALKDAGETRLRPILMTTAAMVFGMLPIALSTSDGSEVKSSLATAIVGGLTSSLIFTLVLVPVMYYIVESMRIKLSGKIKGMRGKSAVTIIVVGLLFLSGSKAEAQTKKISLKDAVSIALESSNDLKSAKLDKFKTSEKVREAYSNAYPVISASGQYMRNIKKPVIYFPNMRINPTTNMFETLPGGTPTEMGSDNSYNATLDISMPIFSGAIYAGVRAAKIIEEQSLSTLKNTENSVITEVKKAYYNVLIVQEQYKLIKQSFDRANQRFQDVKLLFNQGLALEVDTLTAYINVENLRPSLIKVESGIRNAKAYLVYQIGLDSKTDVELTDELAIKDNSVLTDYDDAYNTAISQRPEISTLEFQGKAVDELINAEYAGHLPTAAIFAQYKVETQANDFKFGSYFWPNSSYIGLNISIPIFSGFKVDSKVQQAKIDREIVNVKLNSLKMGISTEVKMALSNLEEAKKSVETQEKIVKHSERNYDLVKGRFKQGLSKLSDMQDAELMLSQTKTNYLQEVYNYLNARVELEKTLGTVKN